MDVFCKGPWAPDQKNAYACHIERERDTIFFNLGWRAFSPCFKPSRH